MEREIIMKDRPTRSQKYQYLLHEISVKYDHLCSFLDEKEEYNERELNLRDLLNERLWQLAGEMLTVHQYNLLNSYYKEGLTQDEVAKKYKITQSSVVKSIFGNILYNKQRKQHYGGSIRKLKKIVSMDEECIELIKLINNEEEPIPQKFYDRIYKIKPEEQKIESMKVEIVESPKVELEIDNVIPLVIKQKKPRLTNEECIVLKWRYRKLCKHNLTKYTNEIKKELADKYGISVSGLNKIIYGYRRKEK